MTQLFQILKNNAPVVGDFGIEIEVEGARLLDINTEIWRTEHDGSLRNGGKEYVFTRPLPRDKVKKALGVLAMRLKNAELVFSSRTSVHVHMNMTEATHEDIINTIYTYLLLEEPLVTYCGRSRKGNRFCLRLQDAEGMLEILSNVFGGNITSFLNVERDSLRYASINIEALQKYGSLEFRAMRGTLDVDTIDKWVEALSRIKTFAKSVKSPAEIYNKYISSSPREFLKEVLGDIHQLFVYPKLANDMARSFSLSIDLPYMFRNRSLKKKSSTKTDPYAIPINPELRWGNIADLVPVAGKKLLDVRSNIFKLQDVVKIDNEAECPENTLEWEDEMIEMIGNNVEYVVCGIENNPDHILLEGVPFVFTPKALRIIRRGY